MGQVAELRLKLGSPDALGSKFFLLHLSFARPEPGSPLGL